LGGDKGFYYWNYRKVISSNNIIVMKNLKLDGYDHEISILSDPEGVEDVQHDIDNNTYYTDNATFTPGGDFEEWKSINNIDMNSKCNYLTDFTLVPNRVYVYPNLYEKRRANIVIYNHQLLDEVQVNVSGVLETGDEYYIYDIEDMQQPVVHGIYDGNSIGLRTDQTTLFPLIGTELYAQPVHSGSDYGAFLLIGRKLDVLGEDLPTSIIENKAVHEKSLKILSVVNGRNNNIKLKISNSMRDKKILIEVYNLYGVNILKDILTVNDEITEYSFSTLNFQNNIYIISVSNKFSIDTKKVVINKN
jgi:hypothetical protein